MRLKELTVQGYKSFAAKTRFEFPPGVTAIVGPNGSGKSNIADAIRWALGEQRTTQLRARKTDDMIFAGTEKRARAGMAEVSLVLDNSDGWLPIDFAEVEVSRRAHRDGTSDYAINGASVRLKDVMDLLGGRLGQSTYTVIGQGLVDSALTLRPEDRRSLIDEAAGIVPLQRRRDAAIRRLDETDVNLTRVKDVLAELTPRLKRMERLAERAEQHDELALTLVADLEQWYGFHLARMRAQVAAATEEVVRLAAASQEARAQVAAREAAFRVEEAELEQRAGELASRRAARDDAAAASAAAQEAAAVAQVRLDGLIAALAENSMRETEDAALGADLMARLESARERAAAASDAALAAEAEWSAARERLAEAEAARRTLAEAWEGANRTAVDAAARADDARVRIADLERLIAQADAEAAARTAATVDMESSAAETALAAAAAATAAASALAQTRTVESAVAAAEDERNRAAERLRAARDAHAEASARKSALLARQRALAAQAAASTDAGAAAWTGTPPGSGRLGEIVDVEPGWEAAAAVALGSLLSGLLVDDDAAVHSALHALAAEFEGQVTLIPSSGSVPAGWEPRAGERRATDLVRATTAPGAVARLLANVAFVATTADAAATVRRPGGPAAAASRDGRMLLATGVAVAGAPAREVIALERERRAVPDLLDDAAKEEVACAAGVDAAHRALLDVEADLAERLRERTAVDAAARDAATTSARAAAASEQESAALAWALEAAARQRAEGEAARARLTALAGGLADLESAAADARAAEAEARMALDAHDTSELTAVGERAADAARLVASDAAAIRAEAEAIQAQIAASALAGAARSERLAAVESERNRLEADLQRLRGEARERADELLARSEVLAPDDAALRDAARLLREQTLELDALRRAASADDAALVDARLGLARAESQMERLLEHFAADEEFLPAARAFASASAGQRERMDDAEEEAAGARLLATPLPELPAVESLPDGIERRITTLRSQLRDLGAIDAEALATYRESAAHHGLLTEQRADLLAAEAEVRSAIDELEAEMSGRFGRTFSAVAAEFGTAFPELFGGGDAKLELDEETGGIDIVARPPGKRAQPLALLSGGERSLTAVALVFALLRASETPFVVLDEVDAALDEANVDRFRSALAGLATKTQVVIVTHNRGTVQTASTVYGVSMGDDGASQTLSVRVDSVETP